MGLYRLHKIDQEYAKADAIAESWADYYFRKCRPGNTPKEKDGPRVRCIDEMRLITSPDFRSGSSYESVGDYANAGVSYALRGDMLDANRMMNRCIERHDLRGARKIADTVLDMAEGLRMSVPKR